MLINVLRKIVPRELRKPIGLMGIRVLNRVTFFGILYIFCLYGTLVRRGTTGQLIVDYKGVKVLFPRSELVVFIEVFCDKLYEHSFAVQEGDVVIDIGASVGLFTLKAAQQAGTAGHIVAIEPEPRSLDLLRENVERNQLTNVKIIGKACGRHRAIAPLYLRSGYSHHSLFGSSGDHIMIDIDSLDNIISDLGLSRIDFIKIDTEGAELDILKGAERVLGLQNIKLAIAAYHVLPNGSPEFPQIVSWLKSRGFQVKTKNSNYVYATNFERTEIAALQGEGNE